MRVARSACPAVLLPLAFVASVHAGAADAASPRHDEIIRRTARMLAEKDYASARELVAQRKDELAPHKAELLGELDEDAGRHVRGATLMALHAILDTRDIPALLELADAADESVQAGALMLLNGITDRGKCSLPRSLDEWRSWWEANRYRLDLDAADCRKRALAVAARYDKGDAIRGLARRLEKVRGEEKWDVAWALDRIARFAPSDRPRPISVVAPFVERLDDPSADVKKSAARVLGTFRDPRAVGSLSAGLMSNLPQDFKVECVAALELIGKPSLSALMRALDAFVPADGPLRAQGDVLRRVCTALVNIGEAEAVPCLLRPLRNRHFANNYAWGAEQAVKRIGLPGIDYLVGHIGNSGGRNATTGSGPFDSAVIVSAAKDLVLSQIIDRWHTYEDRSAPRDELRKRYTHKAAAIIARLKSLFAGPDAAKRLGAAICLAWLGDREAGRFLVSILKTGDQDRPRLDAIEAVGFTKSEEAVPVLMKLLRGEDVRYATIAAIALGRIGSEAAVDDLVSVLRTKEVKSQGDGRLMGVAAYSLGQIGDPRALPAILEAAGPKWSRYTSIRNMSILALANFPGKESFAAVVSGLSSSRRQVKWAAVDVLETWGDPESVDQLINILKHWESSLQCHVIRALGGIGDRRSVPALLPFLKHKRPYHRMCAACALGRIGDPAALPALREAMDAPANSDNYSVQDAIRRAIKALEGVEGKNRAGEDTGGRRAE